MTEADLIQVEVAYALPDQQLILPLRLPLGFTALQAIEQSGILRRFPDIDLARDNVGVFGKVVPLARVLQKGDRVEIYRSLIADPKLARRQRARQVTAG